MPRGPSRLLLAAVLVGGLFWVGRSALRVSPATPHVPVMITGKFADHGWYPGRSLDASADLRAWGSWCESDENTGAIAIGPFAAPARLRIAVGGYPNRPGNQLYVENAATKTRLPIEAGDVGEGWKIVDRALPPEWRGQPVTLHARDDAKQNAGWLAVTEPVRGGRGGGAGITCLVLAIALAGVVLFSRRSLRPADSTAAEIRPVRDHWVWLVGAVALLPLVWCARTFADVWWFGDEWDQLDLIARMGFWRWTVWPFGENVVPLFKAAWGGVALASGGSYWPMLLVVWLTHALNTALFGRVLRGAGFGWAGTGFACVTFALTVANAEILGWSIQWSNALAVLFLLLGLAWMQRHPPLAGTRGAWRDAVLALCVAASALTFVRGVLTGIVLAIGTFWPGTVAVPRAAQWRRAAACLVPALIVVGWIMATAPGNHRDLGHEGLWRKALEFAAWFWAAVPLHRLLEVQEWDAQATVLLGATKLVLVVGGLSAARGPMRQLLALLFLFDLGNAALLGVGRYQTGLTFANSSRYYYNALICTLPFVALACDRVVATIRIRMLRTMTATVLVVATGICVARTWPHEAEMFAQWRGRNTREVLLRDPHPPVAGAVPGIPFLRTDRAKELIAIYHLH